MNEQAPTGAGSKLRLTLLTRRECPLCDEFHLAFARWNAGHGAHELNIVDVDSNPLLAARFGTRIPVLLHEDAELCAVRFCEDKLALRAGSG